MCKKISDFLAGIPATLVGGVLLLCSFFFPKLGIKSPIDPAWGTVLISGIPLLYLAVLRTVHNTGIAKISSAHLICIAMFAAIYIGDLFAAGEVAFIMAIGAILEDMTTNRAKKGLENLIALAPMLGRRITNGKEELIAAEKICLNDILRILPGETVPVDGIIISGETSVDQSVMTGESLPVDKSVNDEVFSGTVNRFGTVDIRATKVGEDSSLQKLIRIVREAENNKAPMARITDIAASRLVPLALLIAVITGIATQNLVRAVTVLVVFCPCALVLATPTAIMAAIGQATKHGVVIKSGEALEKMGKINTIAFDKTGTLTYGKPEVCDIYSFSENMKENDILSTAASAEAKSEHPLGKAVVRCAKNRRLSPTESDEFKMTAGKGVYAKVNGKKILCGNETFLKEHNIPVESSVNTLLEKLHNQGKASILVAENEKCIGVLAMSDVLRPKSKEAIRQLHDMNTDIILLTGDNRETADYFARQAGIRNVRAGLLPEEKVNNIAAVQKDGQWVCMVGDGVNDAPALKTADVGVAMGGLGSDIAVDSADIVLMNDDISKLPYLKRLSDATVKTIKLSITLSMCINFLAVTLSVLGILNPTTGALVHNIGSCFVVMVAALLYDRKFE